MQNALGNPTMPAPAATDYMHLMGLVALGYMWCRIAAGGAGQGARPTTAPATAWRRSSSPARFFMERMLPETATRLARIKAGAASVMALPAEAF